MRRRARRAALAVAVVAVVGAVSALAATGSPTSTSVSTASTASTCHLANGIQHVIDIMFDNVHVNRDNPNVLSDIEQMPALYNFITSNGTLLTNNHTPMIAHTANDLDHELHRPVRRPPGQGRVQRLLRLHPTGGVTPSGRQVRRESSSATGRAAEGATASRDGLLGDGPAAGSAPSRLPRRGCRSPAPGATSAASRRPTWSWRTSTPTSRTSSGRTRPEAQQLPTPTIPELVQGSRGRRLHRPRRPLREGQHVLRERGCEVRADEPSNTAVADVLPDEPGGYDGYQAVFGHKYLQPSPRRRRQLRRQPCLRERRQLTRSPTRPGTSIDLGGKEIDGAVSAARRPGFPASAPITAAQTLAYIADMQESGVPGHLRLHLRRHEKESADTGPCSPASTQAAERLADGPGDNCY